MEADLKCIRIDCDHVFEVGKQGARFIEGTTCPQCDGRVILTFTKES